MTKKRVLISIFFLIILTLIALIGLYFYYHQLLLPVSISSVTPISENFVITPAETASSITNRLEQQRLIKSAGVALVYLKLSNLEDQFKPGAYQLRKASSTPDIITILTKGPLDIKLTFPEGWRREQIADRLATSLSGFSRSEFLLKTATLEGQLFPDTYLFSPSASTDDILTKFSQNFSQKSGLILPAQQDLLILASLVERETKNDSDRRLVASVLFNRLKIGMPLQIDATVQYARDTAKCQLLNAKCTFWSPVYDTKFVSPFNTYLNPSLPPGPIANPGFASIQAILHPQVSDYLYYLTDSDGVTHYAKDLDQHNLNVDKYLRF